MRNETFLQRMNRERQEKIEAEAKAQEKKEMKREIIGMVVCTPIFFAFFYFLYVTLWAITPPHMW